MWREKFYSYILRLERNILNWYPSSRFKNLDKEKRIKEKEGNIKKSAKLRRQKQLDANKKLNFFFLLLRTTLVS